MGWNTVQAQGNAPLLAHLEAQEPYAYFVHSYAIGLSAFTTARAQYGLPFSACVQRNNFHGVQFHPERSAQVGARVLQNFLAQRASCD
jgi:glutamine amidotransferase